MTGDYVMLAHYHNWANRKLLRVAGQIPQEQLMADAGLSSGSAFETMRHMLDVDWSWRLACMGVPAKQLLWEVEGPLDEFPAVRAYWREEGARLLEYVEGLSGDDLEREVVPSWMRKPYKIKHIIMHIVNHGTGHRSEVGWYFTRLGRSPKDLEFLNYIARARS